MNSHWLGLLLVIAGLVLLVMAPDEGSALHLLGGLACLVPGALLAGGLIGRGPNWRGTPSTPSPSDASSTQMPTAPAVFRCARPGIPKMLLLVPLVALFPGLALFAAVEAQDSMRWIALPLLLPGILLVVYLRAHYGRRIHVDADGIRTTGGFRRVAIRWRDVDQLQAFEVRSQGATSLGSVFRVRARHRSIGFSDAVVDVDQLAQIIAAATGRSWQT